MTGKRTLGTPLREICTMGSKRGDEYKRPRSLGEGTGSKEPDYSAAPQWATASRLVPTHQVDLPDEQHGYRAHFSAHTAVRSVRGLIDTGHTKIIEGDLAGYFDSLPLPSYSSPWRAGSLTGTCCI
jgi:hypothetical protein